MCWNSSEYGGFSDVKPWLALNEHASEINVEKQKKSFTMKRIVKDK